MRHLPRMAFAHTHNQLVRGEKTVTRRRGWRTLRPGTRVLAVTGRSASARTLGVLTVVDARVEPLSAITSSDCACEGFPHLSPAEFVVMFAELMGCEPSTKVTRIEFTFEPAQLGLFDPSR